MFTLLSIYICKIQYNQFPLKESIISIRKTNRISKFNTCIVVELITVSWIVGGGNSGTYDVTDGVSTTVHGKCRSDRVGQPCCVAASTRTSYFLFGCKPVTIHSEAICILYFSHF